MGKCCDCRRAMGEYVSDSLFLWEIEGVLGIKARIYCKYNEEWIEISRK